MYIEDHQPLAIQLLTLVDMRQKEQVCISRFIRRQVDFQKIFQKSLQV